MANRVKARTFRPLRCDAVIVDPDRSELPPANRSNVRCNHFTAVIGTAGCMGATKICRPGCHHCPAEVVHPCLRAWSTSPAGSASIDDRFVVHLRMHSGNVGVVELAVTRTT